MFLIIFVQEDHAADGLQLVWNQSQTPDAKDDVRLFFSLNIFFWAVTRASSDVNIMFDMFGVLFASGRSKSTVTQVDALGSMGAMTMRMRNEGTAQAARIGGEYVTTSAPIATQNPVVDVVQGHTI